MGFFPSHTLELLSIRINIRISIYTTILTCWVAELFKKSLLPDEGIENIVNLLIDLAISFNHRVIPILTFSLHCFCLSNLQCLSRVRIWLVFSSSLEDTISMSNFLYCPSRRCAGASWPGYYCLRGICLRGNLSKRNLLKRNLSERNLLERNLLKRNLPERTWEEFAWEKFAWEEFTWEEFAWEEFAWEEFAWEEFVWGAALSEWGML